MKKKIQVKKMNESEYIIYLLNEYGVKIKAFVEPSLDKAQLRVNELSSTENIEIEIINKMEKKQHPLIIVFYLDADMMKNPNIIGPFSDAINDMLFKKDVNALAFFIPTTGEERVECLNPVIMSDSDNDKITKIIEDIKKNFSIGDGSDIELPKEYNDCVCKNNPEGGCQC